MKVLDLFSGIGGFSLGLERAGMQTVAFCEIDPFCRQVLAKHWPDVPIYTDIRELSADAIGSTVDVICGGYPCQPFSTAGKRRGQQDDRHLWPEYLRLIRELRPTWIIGENVAGHISMGLDDVLADLEREGYAWEAFVIPAVAVDAKHRRDRVWIVGHANSDSQSNGTKHAEMAELPSLANTSSRRCCLQSSGENKQSRGTETVSASIASDSDSERLEVRQGQDASGSRQVCGTELGGISRWPAEPPVGRVANGVPRRVDRLRALGNAVVPQIPEIIGQAIMALDAGNN